MSCLSKRALEMEILLSTSFSQQRREAKVELAVQNPFFSTTPLNGGERV